MRMFFLESGNPDLLKARTRSILADMGVESKLSLVPATCSETGDTMLKREFEHSLPLQDLDHGLHHVMETLTDSCFGGAGVAFDKQLRAMSNFFQTRQSRALLQDPDLGYEYASLSKKNSGKNHDDCMP